jgi:hypothetical protein
MNQVYVNSNQQHFAVVNGEVVQDIDIGMKCVGDIDGNGLCILNDHNHNKPLMEVLMTDFPLAKKSRSIKKKAPKKRASASAKKSKKKSASAKKSKKKSASAKK